MALRALVLALAVAPASCVVRIELSRTMEERLFAKQSAPNVSVVALDDFTPYTIYSVNVSFGTPGQKLRMAFDLNASDTWVPAQAALTTESKKSYYTPSRSSTYRQVDRVFTTGFAKGDWARDVVSLGTLRVEEMEFGVAKNFTHSHIYENIFPTDGIMGFGFSDGGVPVVLRELVKAEEIPEPIFAFYLGKDRGELALGGPSDEHYEGDFHFVGLAHNQSWAVAVDGVRALDDDLWMPTSHIHPMPWSAVILGPNETIAPFMKKWEAVGATNVNNSDLWHVACDTRDGPALQFKIDGKDYTIDSQDMIFDMNGTCIVGAFAGDNITGYGQEWYLGVPFLKKYYTQFDATGEKRIGFAMAKHPADNFV